MEWFPPAASGSRSHTKYYRKVSGKRICQDDPRLCLVFSLAGWGLLSLGPGKYFPAPPAQNVPLAPDPPKKTRKANETSKTSPDNRPLSVLVGYGKHGGGCWRPSSATGGRGKE